MAWRRKRGRVAQICQSQSPNAVLAAGEGLWGYLSLSLLYSPLCHSLFPFLSIVSLCSHLNCRISHFLSVTLNHLLLSHFLFYSPLFILFSFSVHYLPQSLPLSFSVSLSLFLSPTSPILPLSLSLTHTHFYSLLHGFSIKSIKLCLTLPSVS